MSFESELTRVAGGAKDALKALITKLGGTVADEKIDGYAELADAIEFEEIDFEEGQPKISASGILKGDGDGGVTAAVAGTDYETAGAAATALTDAKSYTDTKFSEVPTEVFQAVRDESTYAEIAEAHTNGRVVVCVDGTGVCQLYSLNEAKKTALFISIYKVDDEDVARIRAWDVTEADDGTTTWTRHSDVTTKAVVDYVKEQNVGGRQRFWTGTKAEYDALETKDDATLYIITDEEDAALMANGGFRVLDFYETLEALKAAVTSPQAGDAYGIGTAAPYEIYIYTKTQGWVKFGSLAGDMTAEDITTALGYTPADQATEDARPANQIMREQGDEVIRVMSSENISLVDKLKQNGKVGVFTIYVQKGCPDNPAKAAELDSSLRGMCHISVVNEDEALGVYVYGWVILFDQEGNMYTRYLKYGGDTPWLQYAIATDSTT